MKLSRVEVQGIRTFKEIEVLDFTDQVGVVQLKGENGHGKTSLWIAVCWVLYGKDPSGLRAPELATWNRGQGIYGLVDVNGHRVVRTWGGNTLRLDGVDATQDDIDKVLGLTFEQFLNSRYIPQRKDSFLDEGAPYRTDLLASVLNLDPWLERSSRAAAEAKTQQRVVDDAKSRLVAVSARLEELETTDLDGLEEEWQVAHAAKGKTIKDSIAQLLGDVDTREKAVETSRAASARAEAHAHAIRTERMDLGVSRDALVAKVNKWEGALASALSHLKALKKGGRCSHCDQLLPVATRSDIEEAEVEVERAAQAADDAEHALQQHTRKFKEVIGADMAAVARAGTAARQLADAQAALDTVDRDLKRARADMKEHWTKPNPYTLLKESRAGRISSLRDDLAKAEHVLILEEETLGELDYWVKAFKDVRLFLVAEALLQLEVEVNSALSQLGLHGWAMHFAADSETKTGSIKRGLAVTIESPTNPRPVPWEVWSGGEAQRLRVATTIGLSNLISAYTGAQVFHEVWDEPTTGMNADGVRDLLQTLKHRAETQGMQIWLIDHRSLESGVFVESLTAVKVDGATHLVRSQE